MTTTTLRPESVDEIKFKRHAARLILLWAYAVFGFWAWASARSILAGGEMTNIPGGLAIIVTALVAGAGLNRAVSYLERKHPI